MPRDGAAAALLAALRSGDDLAMSHLLQAEARVTVDTGDHGGGSVRGRARVIRTLRRLLVDRADAVLEPAQVNGCPGLALRRDDGTVIGVLTLPTAGAGGDDGTRGSVGELWLQMAPAKLEHWNRRCSGASMGSVTDRGPDRSE